MRVVVFVAFLSCLGCGVDGEDGQQGPAGEQGLAGKDGVDGEDGTNNHIIANISCGGQLENTTLWFRYSAVLLSAGDVWASASIKDNGLQVGDSVFYSAQQVGATTAAVVFTGDFFGSLNAGWWNIGANRQTDVATIEYNDVDVLNGKLTWTMNPSACTASEY